MQDWAEGLEIPEPARGVARALMAQAGDWSVRIAAAFLILVIGLWLTYRFVRLTRRMLERAPRVDATMAAFLASIVRFGLYAMLAVAILQQLGVATASIVAVLGAATLAIGLALQGALGNVAAGVMLAVFRPYKIGDFVMISTASGTVADLNLFVTELTTIDNVKVVVPNSQAWGQIITNYSAFDTRRSDYDLLIPLTSDVEAAKSTVLAAVAQMPADWRPADAPAPYVNVTAVNDYALVLTTRLWFTAASFWDARFASLLAMRKALDAHGFEAPAPRQATVFASGDAAAFGDAVSHRSEEASKP